MTAGIQCFRTFYLAICPSLSPFLSLHLAAMDAAMGGLLEGSEGEDKGEESKALKGISRSAGKKSAHEREGSAAASSAPAEKKKITEVMRQHKTLFSLIIKQVLANTQAERDAMQILYDVYLSGAEIPPILLAIQQNTLYNKKIQKAGKGHSLGPPFVYTALGLFAGLLQIAPEGKKEEIKNIIKTYKEYSLEEKVDLLKFCRIVKTFDASKKKLVLSWGPGQLAQEFRSTIMGIMTNIENMDYKVGRPPAGYMERELSLWLKEMIGKP